MFVGYVNLNDTFLGAILFKDVNETPRNPDSATWRVYGPGGLMTSGTGICTKLDTLPGLYEYAIPATGENGYEVGKAYRVIFTAQVNGLSVGQDHTFIVT